MRVLLVSDLAQTGFGRVGRELATGLMDRGHDVRIIGINYRGVAGEFDAIARKSEAGSASERIAAAAAALAADPLIGHIIPASDGGDAMGYGLTAPALRGTLWPNWRPEAMVVVADPKAMLDRLARDDGSIGQAGHHGVRILNYVPIEGRDLPPSMRILWQHVTPVAMSAFGQAELERLLGRPVPLAHHGVSPSFRPITPADPATFRGKTITSREDAREALGFTGRTVILRTDRYGFRKNYPALFRVLRPVLAAHPEAIAVLHTALLDEQGDLRESLSREPGATHAGGLDWEHPQYRLTRAHDSYRGVSDEELRLLYAAADLYVSTTMAEGFGLCLAESLACGTPVVVNDYSAVGEVVGPGGILVPPSGYITNGYAHEWSLADEPAMTAAVERLISKPSLRRELGALGRQHVARFTWSAAVDVFDGLLAPVFAAEDGVDRRLRHAVGAV